MDPIADAIERRSERGRALITGGAGFIGSHVADALLESGWDVRVLDCLDEQVHGPEAQRPDYLDERAELVVGDVRDRDALDRALEDVTHVVHLAAAVGVGQSMYEIERYTSVNSLGTAALLEALLRRSVSKLVVASSMSIYGEGLYRTAEDAFIEDAHRRLADLQRREWELLDENGGALSPVPTPESKRPELASIYALTKYEQERQCLIFGRAYGVPTVALRFFNTYGARQALSNPYTGVIAIFAARLLNGRSPVIYEDGRQQRDFVHVRDVARAVTLALESDGADGLAVNIGSGAATTIGAIAHELALVMGRDEIDPEITGEHRAGDIRHCFADISLAKQTLGYAPVVTLRDGLRETVSWIEQQSADDRVDSMREELRSRGLTIAAPSIVGGNGRNGVKLNHAAKPHSSELRETNACPARVVITGGCGFIGVNLGAHFAERGSEVTLIDNFSREGAGRNAAWIKREYGDWVRILEGDVRNRGDLVDAIEQADAIAHLAAQVAVTESMRDPLRDFDVNVRGTLTLLETVRQLNPAAHLLYTSSNKVYGGLDDLSLRETATHYEPVDDSIRTGGVAECRLCFESPYGCSKGAADQYVIDYARTFGLNTTVFRMSCIYGPHQHGNEDQGWVAHFMLQAMRRQPITIYGDGKQVRDVLHVHDLASAAECAFARRERVRGRAFNIGGGAERAISLIELLRIIEVRQRRRPVVRYGPWRRGDQRYYVSDTSAFSEATGWKPRISVNDGVKSLHQWLRDDDATRKATAEFVMETV